MSHLQIDLNSGDLEELSKVAAFLTCLIEYRIDKENDVRKSMMRHTLPPAPEAQAAPVSEAAPASIVDHAQSESPSTPADVDATGIRWDERIHSSNRKKNADGTWRKRKGVDKAEFARISAELAPAPQAAPAPEANPFPQPEQAAPAPEANPFPQPEQAAPAPEAQAAPAQPTAASPQITWPLFLQRLAAAKNQNRLDEVKQRQLLQANNVAAIPLLANRPDLYPLFISELGL